MDNGEEYSGDNLRQEQLEGLRRLVLPGLTFLLHNVLHTSEQFTECLKLADIVTSEHYRLFQVRLKHIDTWVKVFRIIPEFRILRLTFHRKSASKS